MNQLSALFWARTKEYYRDKGSLIWSFVMPPLIIAVVALAFSREDPALFKVGLYPADQPPPVVEQSDYIQTVVFDDLVAAEQKVRHHQLDLLILTDGSHQYRYNPESQNAKVLRDLLNARNQHTAQADNAGWQGSELEGRKVRYVDWVIPGILGMNLMFSGLFGVGYVIVRYRKNGVLKRLQAAPVSPYSFLAAQVLSRLMIMLAVSIIIYVVSDWFIDFLMLGSYWNLLLIALTGNLCLLSLGLIVASRLSNEELANGLLNFLTFPMLLLSEVWFSLDGAPQWMSQVAQLLPLTHMVQAAREVMVEGATLGDISHHLVVMCVMTAVFLIISAKIFKWRSD
ncbi:ABC transporter permease [Aestuariicella hydrocarbonica]|uniref:ABC transporter permease n=1 Tax=Pseudomaricurvus hydrocarbonicus TaxID=1470433 RepID=A0A9E5JTQ0_9GAMM|nr:ABC transporter permease [Aestuariicella hydrocarbonica]NHO65119.1 ABC transporter permease [Aestuariicella hydrocarbonica]